LICPESFLWRPPICWIHSFRFAGSNGGDRTDGYTEEEKLQIARKFLVVRQIENHGLKTDQVIIPDETILEIIHSYTREAAYGIWIEILRLFAALLPRILPKAGWTRHHSSGKLQGNSRACPVPSRNGHTLLGTRDQHGTCLDSKWRRTHFCRGPPYPRAREFDSHGSVGSGDEGIGGGGFDLYSGPCFRFGDR
jgi:hypothetical protein